MPLGLDSLDIKLKRVLAFFVDMLVVILPYYFVIFFVLADLELTGRQATLIHSLAMCAVFLFKDIFGRSLGKRIFGLRIVYDNEACRYSFFRLLLRNFTLILWFVEAILLFQDKKRLGDKLMATNVIEVKSQDQK